MPNPIPFSVAAVSRQGIFKAPAAPVAKPAGGYTKIHMELDIPVTAEYENPANVIVVRLLVNGIDPAGTWVGGHNNGNPAKGIPPNPAPAFEWDISRVPDGATLQFQAEVNLGSGAPMTVGVKNGAVS